MPLPGLGPRLTVLVVPAQAGTGRRCGRDDPRAADSSGACGKSSFLVLVVEVFIPVSWSARGVLSWRVARSKDSRPCCLTYFHRNCHSVMTGTCADVQEGPGVLFLVFPQGGLKVWWWGRVSG